MKWSVIKLIYWITHSDRGSNLRWALNSHCMLFHMMLLLVFLFCPLCVLSRGFLQDVLIMSFLGEVCWCMEWNVKYRCHFYSRILLHNAFFLLFWQYVWRCILMESRPCLLFAVCFFCSNLIEDNVRQFQQDWETQISLNYAAQWMLKFLFLHLRYKEHQCFLLKKCKNQCCQDGFYFFWNDFGDIFINLNSHLGSYCKKILFEDV